MSPDVAMLSAPFRCTHRPALSAEAESRSKWHCQKWHHEAESLRTDISAMGPKEF